MATVNEKLILAEAAGSMLPVDQVWAMLADLGIGTRDHDAEKVREVVLKHAETNHWPTSMVEAALTRIGAQGTTEAPVSEESDS